VKRPELIPVYMAYDPESNEVLCITNSDLGPGVYNAEVYRFFDGGWYTRYNIYKLTKRYISDTVHLPETIEELTMSARAFDKFKSRVPSAMMYPIRLRKEIYVRNET
jgi:hypothetical protein